MDKSRYDAIFSSREAVHHFIYGDKGGVSKIFGDQEFVGAFLSSRYMGQVYSVIRSEASKGELTSVKFIIWLSDLYYKDAADIADAKEKFEAQKGALVERIIFCEAAINLGLKEQSYPAMVSCANLYGLLESNGALASDELPGKALDGIISNAKLFLESGYDDPELIADAKGLIKYYEPLAKLRRAVRT